MNRPVRPRDLWLTALIAAFVLWFAFAPSLWPAAFPGMTGRTGWAETLQWIRDLVVGG